LGCVSLVFFASSAEGFGVRVLCRVPLEIICRQGIDLLFPQASVRAALLSGSLRWLILGNRLMLFGARNLTPAVFNIADGEVAGLIAAINTANTNDEGEAINLATNGRWRG
jgi:hypothetical protein